MEIPYKELNKDILAKVIESFIGREGTDYGEHVYTMEQKVSQVMQKLEAGKAVITFDADTESCDIIGR